jgi:lysophospholipid acyltransferase (LPLAT)-like uncharacterized protein
MASPSLRRTDADTRERLAEARRQAGRDAPWRRRFRDWRRRLAGGLAVRIAPRLIRLLARSWRLEVRGAEAFEAQLRAGPAILVLWHGRMLPASALFRDRGFAVLVSPSGDGELAVGVLKRLGCLAFRGSTSRGGSRALRVLADHLAAGRTVGMTPDGPRGPRHTFRVGAPWLARETGAPIITLAFATDSAWRLRSWDRFAVPKPRARVVVSIGVGVRVPREMDDAGLEEISAALRERLIADERAVFVALGVPHDHDA